MQRDLHRALYKDVSAFPHEKAAPRKRRAVSAHPKPAAKAPMRAAAPRQAPKRERAHYRREGRPSSGAAAVPPYQMPKRVLVYLPLHTGQSNSGRHPPPMDWRRGSVHPSAEHCHPYWHAATKAAPHAVQRRKGQAAIHFRGCPPPPEEAPDRAHTSSTLPF